MMHFNSYLNEGFLFNGSCIPNLQSDALTFCDGLEPLEPRIRLTLERLTGTLTLISGCAGFWDI